VSDAKRQFEAVQEALASADRGLVDALEARARAVRRFQELREQHPESYFGLPSRESVLQAAQQRIEAFPRAGAERVLREVLGISEAMIAPTRVAIGAPLGGHVHLAALRFFGTAAEVDVVEGVRAVFDEVERKRASSGVVPFETSSEGAVAETIEGLVSGEARVCGEILVENSFHLVSKTGNGADVEKIYAPAPAIASCERVLRSTFPKATLLDVMSSEVAMTLAREDHGAAAVVVQRPREDDGLRLVQDRIEDRVGVVTRFLIVGHQRPARTGQDRTLLALALPEGPGALYAALQPFADRGVDLTRIESRPAKGTNWRYLFVLELDGHVTDRNVLTTIEEVRGRSRHLKVLGSYPRPAAA
jgi:chorismate mutase/prephenate dehydratase